MSEGQRYELILTPPVRPGFAERLPEPVAAAVIDFITPTLVMNPQRAGEPPRRELAGIWSARRGTYRVLYRILEELREVVLLKADQRRDVCRSG